VFLMDFLITGGTELSRAVIVDEEKFCCGTIYGVC